MSKNPLNGLLIRSASVLRSDLGFILACDPRKEGQEIPHTISFTYHSGVFNKGEAKFNAHTCCVIKEPEPGWVKLSNIGIYSVETRKGVTVGNIFNNSQPQPTEDRYGDFRRISEIGGKAYAVGLGGMVYRLDELDRWTRIDETLPRSFDIEGIHGFDSADIYAAGYKGELWHFDGEKWDKIEIPTNVIIGSVKCGTDGVVYIGGNKGILVCGRGQSWEIIDHDKMADTIWGLEWFKSELYISTMSSVYRLKRDQLELVDFGNDPPKTNYQLSAAEDVIWSIGREDIMSYNGKTWSRVI